MKRRPLDKSRLQSLFCANLDVDVEGVDERELIFIPFFEAIERELVGEQEHRTLPTIRHEHVA